MSPQSIVGAVSLSVLVALALNVITFVFATAVVLGWPLSSPNLAGSILRGAAIGVIGGAGVGTLSPFLGYANARMIIVLNGAWAIATGLCFLVYVSASAV